jgi:hypothetical protein
VTDVEIEINGGCPFCGGSRIEGVSTLSIWEVLKIRFRLLFIKGKKK